MLGRIRRTIRYFLTGSDSSAPEGNVVQQLSQSGNLAVGVGSDLKHLHIHHYGVSHGIENITVGANSMIQGKIVLYNEASRVKIGSNVFIGPDTSIYSFGSIEVMDDVMISWGCTLIDTDTHSIIYDQRKNDVKDWMKGPKFKDWSKVKSAPIRISNKSWIGFNSIVLKGVVLGEGTIVGAGSVVTKSTEKYSIVGGNPAVFIKFTS